MRPPSASSALRSSPLVSCLCPCPAIPLPPGLPAGGALLAARLVHYSAMCYPKPALALARPASFVTQVLLLLAGTGTLAYLAFKK